MFLLFNLLNKGGVLFMCINLLVLVAIIVFLVKAFSKQQENTKAINLIKHLSLFALVWGVLGQLIGFIDASDAIQVAGDVPPHILAAGLRVALLSSTFGIVIFIIARIGLIALVFLNKNK